MELPQLPDDLLANVLGRLPPRSVAAARCVRKDWCAVVDTRCLLRADLLPLRLDGFFCLGQMFLPWPMFFARPSTGRLISGGRLDFMGTLYSADVQILDHCNGLLLLWEKLVNPATRQWVPLPPFPPQSVELDDFYCGYFFVYDPTVSPHYEVFIIPLGPNKYVEIEFKEDMEWPPSPYTAHVFSSRKQVGWEKRSFVREGKLVGIIGDMRGRTSNNHGVYLRGALYVLCENDYIMRITLSNDKYQMIKSPAGMRKNVGYNGDVYLGKSKRGVYTALLWDDYGWLWPQFRVWLLNDQNDQMEWVLKADQPSSSGEEFPRL